MLRLITRWKKKTSKSIKQMPKAMALGIAAVILLYISAAGMISVTYPWFANDNSDELAHVDMIYRIYNGDLPKASDGVRYQPFIELGGGNIYQRAAGHPPLFHMIMAPFMGPLLNAGEWKKAMAVGRTVNIFIGILTILALAWAGWMFGGKRKALFAVAVPALGVLTFRFSRVNTDLSMDALLALLSTLTLINLYKIIQNGLKVKYLIFLSFLSVAGMATKASYGVFLGLSLLVIIIASYIHGDKNRRSIIKGSAIAAAILGLVIVAIGWYYYFRNYRVSGSLLTPIQGELASGRPHNSYLDIIASSNFWALFYARYSTNVVISVIISIFALSGYFSMKKIDLRKLKKNTAHLWAIGLMALAFLGVVATQLMLAHPNGSINFRYLLPAILPISLFLAYGLLEFKWLRGQLVALAAIAMVWTTILWIGLKPAPDGLLQGISEWGKSIHKIYIAAAENNVLGYVTSSLFWVFAIGSVLLCISLFQLSKPSIDE